MFSLVQNFKGFNVYPMGWDSLVCPAKPARQNKLDPKTWTEANISTMKSQLKKLGYLLIGIEKFQPVLLNIINTNRNFFRTFDKGLILEKNNM